MIHDPNKIINSENSTEDDDIDFEISFYEDVVKANPDFTNALILLGDAYTQKGLHDKALEIDQRLSGLLPADSTVHYNLACDYSLLKNAQSCLETLDKALKLGYRAFKHMEKDPDLEFIRQDPRYKELLLKYRKK